MERETAAVLGLSAAALVAFWVGYVCRGLMLRRLRDHHSEQWNVLGRPNPWFPGPNYHDQLPYAKYFKRG